MATKPVLPPNVPGVGDLHSLLAHLEYADKRSAWIAEAKKVLDANLKAVRLLGAEDEIQKNLDKADRLKADAQRAMDNARAQSEVIVEKSGAECAKRAKDLDEREAAFESRMASMNKDLAEKTQKAETDISERTVKLNALEAKLKAQADDLAKRENAISPREKRVETQMEAAKAMKAEAEAMKSRLQAAMQ